MSRPATADIDLSAYLHNLRVAKSLAPGARILAVVKANAYGHGIQTVGKHIAPYVDALGVACLEEAVALRWAGVNQPILLLEGPLSIEEVIEAEQHKLTLNICSEHQISWLEEAHVTAPLTCWLKIDSGMHRLGVPLHNARKAARRLQESSNCRDLEVVCTHFACADEPESPSISTQAEHFLRTAAPLQLPLSMANSATLFNYPQYAKQWIRPGYLLTGNSPLSVKRDPRLKPAMTLRSSVISIREVERGHGVGYGYRWIAQRNSRIATVAIGYGDGYPRSAPDGTPTIVSGTIAPIAGRVSMDMLTIDVTGLDHVDIGSPVTLWGQDMNVNEIADHAGTIGYELLTRVSGRVARNYVS